MAKTTETQVLTTLRNEKVFKSLTGEQQQYVANRLAELKGKSFRVGEYKQLAREVAWISKVAPEFRPYVHAVVARMYEVGHTSLTTKMLRQATTSSEPVVTAIHHWCWENFESNEGTFIAEGAA